IRRRHFVTWRPAAQLRFLQFLNAAGMNNPRSRPFARLCRGALLACCAAALPLSAADPFGTEKLTPPNQSMPLAGGADACARQAAGSGPLTLAGVIERALCNNPQTRQSWTAARTQAAQVGRSRAEYLPQMSIDALAGTGRTWPADGGAFGQDNFSASATVSYLLFDFGARDANLDSARQLLEAANWSHSASLQSVFLFAIQSYYQLFAAGANVDAALEAEKASEESLKAAESRYRVGTGTPADRLQAKTAYSQAVLIRTRAEGWRRRVSRRRTRPPTRAFANWSITRALCAPIWPPPTPRSRPRALKCARHK